MWCCSSSVVTMYGTCNVIVILNVLKFYIHYYYYQYHYYYDYYLYHYYYYY